MKKVLCLTSALCLLIITPKTAHAWIEFLDGSTLPAAPWQPYQDGGTDGGTAVVDFFDPELGATNQAVRVSSGTNSTEWYLGPLFANEVVAAARFKTAAFSGTGSENLLCAEVGGGADHSAAPSITIVTNRYKLWSYTEGAFGLGTGGSEILDLGPVVGDELHTAYIYAHRSGLTRLWWDGRLVFEGLAPLVSGFDGYMEWGSGVWQYKATTTVDFDWVGFSNNSTNLPIYVLSVPADGTPFHDAAAGFSFTVVSVNGVASNGVGITVNGVDRTGDLVITGNNTNRQGSLGGLLPDHSYQVVLRVTDLATNSPTYTINFQTFSQSYFMFEAEDWNFDGGQFLDAVVLSSTPGPSNYLDRAGVEDIDQHELSTDLSASQHQYRLNSLVGTEVTGDFLRQKYIDAQVGDPLVADYDVGWVEVGEWLNYTRTFPPGDYLIYGRLASGNPGAFEASLAKVAGATTTNQTTTALGTFKGNAGHGWQSFDWIPLTDALGNPAVVRLSGLESLRVTDTQGAWNANFYMLVPAPPKLDIALANGQAVVSWPTNPPNFNLQSTPNLSPANWVNFTGTVALVNGRYTVTNDLSSATRFFRLWH